jgi:hypothetical protein
VEALAALGGVVLGAVLTYFSDRRQQDRAARERWAERASETLADVEMLLTAAHPPRAALGLGAHGVFLLREQSDTVRRAVAVLAAGHPDGVVRELAGRLEAALYNTLSMVESLAESVREAQTYDEVKAAAALENHGEAQGLARDITDRIHA